MNKEQIDDLTEVIHHVLFSFRTERCRELAKTIINNGYQKVPRAKWLVARSTGICSNCNRLDTIDNLATYCRYCGAYMEEQN